jgi:hypothetical protein
MRAVVRKYKPIVKIKVVGIVVEKGFCRDKTKNQKYLFFHMQTFSANKFRKI